MVSMHAMKNARWFATAVLIATTAFAQAPPLVVETDPLPPDQQRAKFHLPPGFEIQLVVSEPLIGQPLNMNFDAAGRLWVTSSVEYPYPCAGEGVEPRDPRWGKPSEHPPRDWLTVIEGIGDDGTPTKVTRFAEGLNIPIGVLPYQDGAIVFSIPDIVHLRDTDGDGRADTRTKLYGPFGNIDTHGMVNSFTRGLDGWIYACHGFANTSRVKGADGHEITMQSGHTFRFRPDGSRIEHWTFGQVNPFGLCFDPWGNLYSADCHSRPLTCLLRGAYYQSFGKPHDGLGFAPDMIAHGHGSTGICGCAWYEAEQFPAEYNGCIFLCNPVTGRVHRDRIDWRGSSPWAVEQPEFVTCDDGWFRPVDVKLGPDGALYIADFYNAIIGHYEVPLDHPRRDRTHGRIWRVVYRGESQSPATAVAGSPRALVLPDLTQLTLTELLERLGELNLTVRYLASHEVLDRFGSEDALSAVRELLAGTQAAISDAQLAHAVWIAARCGRLQDADFRPSLRGESPVAIAHWLRAAAEEAMWTDAIRSVVTDSTGPQREQEIIERLAIDAIGRHPFAGSVGGVFPLVGLPSIVNHRPDDVQFVHACRIALRNQLRVPENVDMLLEHRVSNTPDYWTEIASGEHSPAGVRVTLAALPLLKAGRHRQIATRHIARYGDDSQLDALFTHIAVADAREWRTELADLHSVHEGFRERGGDRPPQFATWAGKLAERLLAAAVPAAIDWTAVPYGPSAREESAFDMQTRRFADGQEGALLHSSFPKGEQRTGILRSDPFELPEKLSFFLCGHNGPPNQPAGARNLVRLVDAQTLATLREALPPRNDVAQPVEWDLTDVQGRKGYIEIVDGDDRGAYAWLAAGRFSIEGLNPAGASPPVEACRLIADLKLTQFTPRLRALAASGDASSSLRLAAAEAVVAVAPSGIANALLAAVRSGRLPSDLREACYARIVNDDDATSQEVLTKLFQSTSAEEQRLLANVLVSDASGGEMLLALVERGAASPRLLQDAGLAERLQSLPLPDVAASIARLTQDLPAPDAALRKLIAERAATIRSSAAALDPARGAALFKQHCGACHQFQGTGEKIGPQLDGVGVRGLDRLLEDVLDPNRNVDAAFRTTILVLADGQVVTGLVRREEGATLILADQQGKEFAVAAADVELRRESPLSLMPSQAAEKLPPEDLSQLMQYLLSGPARAVEASGN